MPAADTREAAEGLKVISKAKRASSARVLADEFTGNYPARFPKTVAPFEAGLNNALSLPAFPGRLRRLLRSTNLVERPFREVERRARAAGVFPSEASALNLVAAVLVRSTEDWALRRCMDMRPLEATNAKPTQSFT